MTHDASQATAPQPEIDQHFIQKAHLRAWSGRDGKISWARRDDRQGWVVRDRRSPKAVGKLTNYFTAEPVDLGPEFEANDLVVLGPEWFEAQFKEIEDEGLPVIQRMATGDMPVGQGNRRRAARYFSMSLLRSYGLREWNRDRPDMDPTRFIPDWARDLPLYTDEQLEQYARALSKHTDALRPIQMVGPLSVIYAKCDWYFVEAPVGSSFILGDGFGTRIDNFALHEPGRNSGMGRSEFFIPISPYRGVLLVQGEEALAWNERDDVLDHNLRDGPSRWERRLALILSRKGSDLVNLCAFAQSKEFIFADFDSRIEQVFAHATVTPESGTQLRNGLPLLPILSPAIGS